MLQYDVMKNQLRSIASYLQEVLGVSVVPEPWQVPDCLPFFLRDKYQFSRFSLLNTPCLLLHDRTECEINPLAVGKHIMQVRQHWDGEVVYLCETISSYARKRMIEQKIQFVVPDTQLYLPSFGIDLREYYYKRRCKATLVSPSTQVVIIHALSHGCEQPFSPSALAKRLGYTSMTMTRAFDELEVLEIGEIVAKGKERLLYAPHGTKTLWQHARSVMRNQVKKRLWTRPPALDWPGVPAGLSALASYTLLAPPNRPVYAMSAAEWRGWKQHHNDVAEFSIPEQEEHSCELELWSYSPRLFAYHDRIDQFSLYLSLQSEEDERVQSALEHMMEQVIW